MEKLGLSSTTFRQGITMFKDWYIFQIEKLIIWWLKSHPLETVFILNCYFHWENGLKEEKKRWIEDDLVSNEAIEKIMKRI